jgi:hypothetical protein
MVVNGKGDRNRSATPAYREGWDRIFNKPKTTGERYDDKQTRSDKGRVCGNPCRHASIQEGRGNHPGRPSKVPASAKKTGTFSRAD